MVQLSKNWCTDRIKGVAIIAWGRYEVKLDLVLQMASPYRQHKAFLVQRKCRSSSLPASSSSASLKPLGNPHVHTLSLSPLLPSLSSRYRGNT